MKILVLVKQVPDSTTNIKISADGSDIDRAAVPKLVVNPFDEFAIELAVQLREKRSDVEQITALTVGPDSAAEALRTVLAIGADDAIHLNDESFLAFDELQLAALIASVARDGGYDLILRGKQEIDLDSGQVGPAVAELLDLPHVGVVTGLEINDDASGLKANRRIEGADEIVECALPALLTIEKGLVEPRYPSLPNLMKAKKKPVKVMAAGDVAGFVVADAPGGTTAHTFEPPPERPPGKILEGEVGETVPQLVKLLRDEAKVL